MDLLKVYRGGVALQIALYYVEAIEKGDNDLLSKVIATADYYCNDGIDYVIDLASQMRPDLFHDRLEVA